MGCEERAVVEPLVRLGVKVRVGATLRLRVRVWVRDQV